jgi:hypothetical protein
VSASRKDLRASSGVRGAGNEFTPSGYRYSDFVSGLRALKISCLDLNPPPLMFRGALRARANGVDGAKRL